MKPLAKIAFFAFFSNRKKAITVLLTIMLSTAMIFTVSAFFASFMQSAYLDCLHSYSKGNRTPAEAHMLVLLDSSYMAFNVISTAFVVLSILGAVSTVYNILSVTTAERGKTLSVLSTLGAGMSHKLMYIFFESLFASFVAIPFGLVLGVCCSLPLTDRLDDLIHMLSTVEPSPFLLGHPLLFFLAIAAISAMTVFAAFIKPFLYSLRKASVEGAKASGAINVSFKDNILDQFMLKKFGVVGKLASCNYTNNKAKYRRLSLSVAIFSVLIMSMDMLKTYMSSAFGADDAMNYMFDLLAALLLIVFIMALIGATGIFYVTFDKRRTEFAMLKSMGTENYTLLRMVSLECVYYFIYTMLFTVIGSLIADYAIYSAVIMMEPKAISFVYPFITLAAVLAISLALTFLLSLFMTYVVKRVNIIDEIKKNY